jgi:hypothetical protein
MMDRRTFLVRDIPAAAVGLTAGWKSSFAAIPTGDKPMSSSYVEFFYIHMQNGGQVARLAPWLEKRLMPLCQKHGFGAMGFFNVTVGPNMPSALIIFSYPSLADMEAQWGKLNSDPDYKAAVDEIEKDEPAFYRTEATLLRSTAFCPPFAATPAGDPAHKIYELRTYESPTHRQLEYLHDRFAGGEIDIFHKTGIHPVLYGDTVFGPNQPNMTYLIPFESEAHREKAWAAFSADPEWIKIRAASVQRGGEIVRNITNQFLSPARFSMLR